MKGLGVRVERILQRSEVCHTIVMIRFFCLRLFTGSFEGRGNETLMSQLVTKIWKLEVVWYVGVEEPGFRPDTLTSMPAVLRMRSTGT